MFWLSAIAALFATPLRLAEAAHDLGRAIGELGGGAVVEAPDDGIGDDSGATITREPTRDPGADASFADSLPCPFVPAHPLAWPIVAQRRRPPPRSAGDLPRRLATLQRFLR